MNQVIFKVNMVYTPIYGKVYKLGRYIVNRGTLLKRKGETEIWQVQLAPTSDSSSFHYSHLSRSQCCSS